MARQVRGNKKGTQQRVSNKPNFKSNKQKNSFKSKNKFSSPAKSRIQDARQKIIQQKRNVVSDARDVLAKKAKTQDARTKLDNMRVQGRLGHNNAGRGNVKVIGNIVQKVDRNGKISLQTNKQRQRAPTSNLNVTIQKQLGLISAPKRSPPKRSRPAQKTAVREMYQPIARTDPGLYKWVKPDLRPASHLIGSLEPTRAVMRDVVREELMMANRWSNLITPKPVRLQPSGYVDLDAMEDDEDMPLMMAPSRIALQGSRRSTNVHARLDSVPAQTISHGILGHGTKTKVVVPMGHRIVVSNLQNSVTEDDIKELFEDIGQLLSAKLVKAGVAEVIYKNLSDAQKAVDTYHNRQLDGQPMKCLLVNKRPLNQPTGMALPKNESYIVRSAAVSNKLVPDLDTIHRVLFQRK